MRYKVYIKSISTDPWGEPVLDDDSGQYAKSFSYDQCGVHGMYSIVVDTETNLVIFEDGYPLAVDCEFEGEA